MSGFGGDSKRAHVDRNAALLAWLEKEGASLLDECLIKPWSLETRRSKHAAGEKLLSIPVSCILTCERAMDSAIGLAFVEHCRAAQVPVSPDQVLWLYMIQARAEPSHEFHAFMQYLPESAPDPVNWEDAQLLLGDTILLPIVQRVRAELDALAETVSEFMRANAAFRVKDFSARDLRWARGHHRSRRFADALNPALRFSSDAIETEHHGGSSQISENGFGVMIPLLDKTNHDPQVKVSWRLGEKEVAFHCEEALDHDEQGGRGRELFNNYGPKSNEMLLLDFGFALPNNVHDSVSLTLCVKDAGGALQRLGPFQVKRKSELWPVFPQPLWRALADPFGENGEGEDDVEVGLDEIELLQAQLEHRLALLSSSEERDGAAASPRERFVAHYRTGQREIIRAALAELDEMLLQEE